MIKKILAACIFSAVAFFSSSALAAPINGLSLNGFMNNGIAWNALTHNGITFNALGDNGLRWNAITSKVVHHNNDIADTHETTPLVFGKTQFLQVMQKTPLLAEVVKLP